MRLFGRGLEDFGVTDLGVGFSAIVSCAKNKTGFFKLHFFFKGYIAKPKKTYKAE